MPNEPSEALGSCRFGVRTCSADGVWGPCIGAVAPLAEDSCEPGADEDCDGIPNEGCPCTDGETRACGSDTGNCEYGTQRCENGVWTACEGGVQPEAQDSCVIVGDDADCDGTPNGGCPCVGSQTEACGECGERTCAPEARSWGPCEPTEKTETCWETESGTPLPGSAPETPLGNCRLGTRTCGADGMFGACIGAVGPEAQDSCSVPGDDATCDGVKNGGCPCTGNESRACGTDVGNCRKGTQTCASGTWGACVGEVAPQTQDRCDVLGDDSNCNGIPNEGCPCVGNETRSCNDCGTQTCLPLERRWGDCTAPQSPPETRCASGGTAVQTCDATGRWKTTTCSTSDSHCTARCEMSGGTASCQIQAKDADGDGAGDKLCAAAPGTDCDDTKASVKPGATEICDGLDNDCDGKIDLSDGLALSGSNIQVTERRYLDLAWNDNSGHFGWVANASTESGVFFGKLTTGGALTILSSPVVPASSTTSYYAQRIVYSSSLGGYGVVYSTGGIGGSFQYFAALDRDGILKDNAHSVGQGAYGAIAVRNNDFVVTHGNAGLRLGRATSSGYVAGSSLADVGVNPRIATSGQLSGIVYVLNNSKIVRFVRADANLNFSSTLELSSEGQGPDIATTSKGYAVAWSTGSGFSFRIIGTNGSSVCGPTNVTFGNGVLDAEDGVAVESTAYGTVVLAADEGGSLHLFRFDDKCALMDEKLVVSTSAVSPNMAVGGSKLAIAWVDKGSSIRGYVRVLNESLCQ